MKSASVRELKNRASELLRDAANEDIIITSRGRPVACLVGLQPGDLAIRPSVGRNYSQEKHRQEAFRLLAGIWKMKPDKGKTWISQEHHDVVLYGDADE